MRTHPLSPDLSAPAYVLVYLAPRDLPGTRWWERTSDPEIRDGPLTWGICRPNVRGFSTMPGAHLFFVAHDRSRREGDQYRLTTYFRVDPDRILDHVQAREQFGDRRNVLLDYLPPGRSLKQRVAAYVDEHRNEICWWDEVSRKTRDDDLTHLEERAADHVLCVDGKPYVHAWWDHHSLVRDGQRDPNRRVWHHAAQKPYLVADMGVSRVLRRSIAYDVPALRQRLPAADLRNRSNHHPQLKLKINLPMRGPGDGLFSVVVDGLLKILSRCAA